MTVILIEARREMGTGIRVARHFDLLKIMEIERLAFGNQWDYFNFKASLDDVFLVAIDADTAHIVGFLIACCCKIAKRGIISRVAVHPGYQGRGIATQLLEVAFGKLKELEVEDVELDVDVAKAGAVRLYERLGFKVVETFSPDFEEDDSFFIMRKKLYS
jgi:ribosomal-protein-alanine N-acetyltransferase